MAPPPVIDVLNPDTYGNGDPARNGIPHDQFDWLRENAPCYRQAIADPTLVDAVWVVTRYEDVLAIDRDPDRYVSRKGVLPRLFEPGVAETGGKPTMICADGDEHRRNRKTVSLGFTPPVVRTFEEHFRELARDVVGRAVALGTFDFLEAIAVQMPLRALADLLGVPEEDRAQFLDWINAFTVPTQYAPDPAEMFAALNATWEYAARLAEKKREHPGEDLMSKVVADDVFSEDELAGFLMLMAGAAAETTRSAISQGLHGLVRHPEQMEWLRERAQDIPDTAVQEIVRWASPVIHFCRTADEDVELHGQEIKAGDKVAMMFVAANFDPAAIAEPLRFDLSRDPTSHLAFGRGPHVCLGRHIAALEIKVLFEELLQATRDIALAGDVEYVRDCFVRGIYRLPLTVAAS